MMIDDSEKKIVPLLFCISVVGATWQGLGPLGALWTLASLAERTHVLDVI